MIDRGMLKWQPFEALEGQHTYLQKMKHRKFAQEMPILSCDQLEELNDKIRFYYQAQEPVMIRYYYDGYFEMAEGIITKLDFLRKKITINVVKEISANMIMEINGLYR